MIAQRGRECKNAKKGPCGNAAGTLWGSGCCLLRFVGDEAVAAVFAPVDDRHGAIGCDITKDEERVLEQVHLQDRFLDAHGLDGEALAAHDLERA